MTITFRQTIFHPKPKKSSLYKAVIHGLWLTRNDEESLVAAGFSLRRHRHDAFASKS
jgi:hypothetical protein